MIIVIPGGMAELRDKLTVGGQQELQLISFKLVEAVKQSRPPGTNSPLDTDALKKAEMSAELLSALFEIQMNSVLVFLKSWNLEEPLPTQETIRDMDSDVYEAIVKHTSPMAMAAANGTKFEPAITEDGIDLANPTENSSNSNEGEEEVTAPTTTPTLTRSSDTENSDTELASA